MARVICGVELNHISNLDESLREAFESGGFDYIVAPLVHPRYVLCAIGFVSHACNDVYVFDKLFMCLFVVFAQLCKRACGIVDCRRVYSLRHAVGFVTMDV
jgi:hypothetical protein